MSYVTIRIPTPLRTFTAGEDELTVEASTVRDALQTLSKQHEGILEQVLAADGSVRRFVNVYLGERNIRSLDGLDTRIENGAVISIVPAVAGGER